MSFGVVGLLFLSLQTNPVLAALPTAELFEAVRSPFFELQEETAESELGEDAIFSRLFRSDILKYEPTGEQKVFSETCEWVRRKPMRPSSDVEFAEKWSSYRQECMSALQNGPTHTPANFYKTLMIRLRLKDHPKFRFVQMKLPSGTRLRGLLALKDNQPRPFVVFRLGIFSKVDQMFAERAFLMQMFEQSPFHVLVLEGMTSPDFIARNTVRAFGGLDEGLQTLHVLKHLRDPNEPISKLVSSLHLMGLSMGAGGQFAAHLLQAGQERGPWVQSSVLLCPPLNLQATLDFHLSHSLRSMFLNAWARRRLQALGDEDPELRPRYFLQDVLEKVARLYRGPNEDAPWISWPDKWREARRDFWKGNEILPLLKDNPTPLFIVATESDGIVPYNLNSGQIVRGQIDVGRAPVRVWTLSEGTHCSLPGAYDWREMTSIFQDYILSHSPEFQMRTERLEFEAETQVSPLKFKVEVAPGDRAAVIRVGSNQYRVSLASLDLGLDHPVTNETEAAMVRRWLHQNLRLSWLRPEAAGGAPARLRLEWDRL